MRRTSLLVATAVLAVAPLAACGSSSGSESSSPAASESVSATVTWADTVCQKGATLRTSVDALGTSISVDPGTDGTALEQVKAQLATQVQTIKGDVAELAKAIDTVPAGADPSVQESIATLDEAKAQVDESVTNLQQSFDTFADADGIALKVVAFKQVVTQAGVVKSDLGAFRTAVGSTAQTAGDVTKQAFAAAPSCQPFITST